MRHGKLFGLCMLAALSLMAISATAAQAVNEFVIGANLKTFTEEKVAEKAITGTAELGFILAEGLTIHCPGGTETQVSGAVLAGGTARANALFKGCSVGNSHCWIWDDLGNDGDPSTLLGKGMITASGTGSLFKHNNEHYLLVEGLGVSKRFALFDIGGDVLCPLGTDEEPFHVEITGSTVTGLLDPLVMPGLTKHKIITLTLSTLKSLFSKHKLALGGNEAHLSKKAAPEAEEPIIATVELTSKEIWGSN